MNENGFDTRVRINQIVENQIPEFLLSESPKFAEFLKQYYISQEYQGGSVDIVENLDQYLKLDNFTSEIIQGKTVLQEDISSLSTNIVVSSTKGFPQQYGLLKIDSEIITYTGISGNTFIGCIRGFSGVTSLNKTNDPENLEFSVTNAEAHLKNSQVINLSALFLQKFYQKLKYTLTPGLENSDFVAGLDVGNFIKESNSFYQSKGTPESFRILFNVLYGETPTVLDLEELLIKPSDANFIRREIIIAELLNPPADPLKLAGQTITKSTDSGTQASVSEVEILARKGKTYYKLFLFVGYNEKDLITGQFRIQPKTKVLENVSIGSSIISVDSTIGFDKSGVLICGNNTVTYTDKSINQFLGCSGITFSIPATSDIRSNEIVYGYENGDLNKKVDLRLTGVLSDFVPTSEIYYIDEKEVISIKNIGEVINNPESNRTKKEIFANSWIYNTSSRYQVKNISGSVFTLFAQPDKSSLDIGDTVEILARGTQNVLVSSAIVVNINQNTRQVNLSNLGFFSPSNSLDYDIRRKIKKATSIGAPIEFGNNSVISDIQNLYIDDEYAYVASNSLPSFTISKKLTEIFLEEATGSPEESNNGQGFIQGYDPNTLRYSQISFSNSVPFISGDAIIYEADNPIPGLVSGQTYYIEVLSPNNKIRLYNSISFVGGSSYVEFDPLTSGSGSHRFLLKSESAKIISPQKILRKFPLNPTLSNQNVDKTEPGAVGLLINGVEILSPKSDDKIYYGPLQSINILNSGKNYDVINPPSVVISPPPSGTTALANVVVRGSLQKITVDPQDFDINAVISASIRGGNGFGAILEPIVTRRVREIEFDARPSFAGGGLDLSDETITFRERHNFIEGEPIFYNSNGNAWLGIGTFGPPHLVNNEAQNKTLINGALYYPKIINSKTIQLYQTIDDYSAGINTVGLTTENNFGIHKFRTLEKNTLQSINVIKFNSIFKTVTSNVKIGVSTISLNSITGINTGDLVVGNASISRSGISTVIFIDNDKNIITLNDSTVGILTSSTKLKISRPNINEYENRQLYVKPIGISTIDHTITFNNHNFKHGDLINYRYTDTPISGLTIENNYYILKINENVFRLSDAGINTESKENFDRNNFVKFKSVGTGYHIFKYPDIVVNVNVSYGDTIVEQINAIPTISGKIVDVYLYEGGSGYGSENIINLQKNPKIFLKNGKDAEVRPTIRNGRIIKVDVLSGGSEYVSTPNLVIESSVGSGAILRPVIVNEKLVNVIVINPGIGYSEETTSIRVVSAGSGAVLNSNIRPLSINKQFRFDKEILLSGQQNLEYSWLGYSYDLAQSNFKENPTNHSPLIGWAYDGNPIYGPYGYSDSERINSDIRLLKPGYILDSSNIFDRPSTSIFKPGFFIEDFIFTGEGDLDKHNGRFAKTPEFPFGVYAYFVGVSTSTVTNKLEPIYPYFVGDTYRSPYVKDNLYLNQDFDFNNSNLSRNTFPYRVSNPFIDNDFLIESNEITNQFSIVDSTYSSGINSLTVRESGNNYKIGDRLVFDDTNTEGGGLSASVSSINGKTIEEINTEIKTYNGSILEWKDSNNILVSINPYHELLDNDTVVISGINTTILNLIDSHKIKVTTNKTTLFSELSSNIIPRKVEDIYVSHIPENVSVGSSLSIENELFEVLNIFPENSILRVRRSDVGFAHSISTSIDILSNNFLISAKTNYFESKRNNKIFFNPKQSVGIGTTIGSSINTQYKIGSVTKEISIPVQSLYLPNHPFKTGQKVILKKDPTSSPFIVSNTNAILAPTFNLPSTGNSQIVYVINKSKDFIGITTRVGLTTGSEGLFFRSNGDDNYEYSIESNFTQVTANISRITATISTLDPHELSNGDKINLNVFPNLAVGIGQTDKVKIKYENNNIKKIIINPVGFDSSFINPNLDIITINSHNLKTGDKIFYTSSDQVASGLSTGNYFVYKVDENNIKLTETLSDLQKMPVKVVNIIGVGGTMHEISLVNPQLLPIKNNDLVFDVSDSSLINKKLKFYYDKNFNNEFIGIESISEFNILGVGTIGITSTATITLKYSDNLPSVLYYNLENFGDAIAADESVLNYSKISFINSYYSGTHSIFGISTNSFDISLSTIPEKLNYIQSECDSINYNTTSKSAKGGINRLRIIFEGYDYKKPPKLLNIISEQGSNADIVANSVGIGTIAKIKILDQGFEYSSDKTLRPEAYISPFISVVKSNFIKKVEVISGGKNYASAPNLILKNPSTQEIINTSQELKANLYSSSISSVDIISPVYGLSSVEHEIVPIDNSNSIGISSIISSNSGIITCILSTPPVVGFVENVFDIGDQILVEGIEKEGIEGSGFNSADYNYSYFTVTSYQNTDPAVVEYDMLGFTTNPGIAKPVQTLFARISNKKNFPQFRVIQEFAVFDVGEQLLVYDGTEFTLSDLYITQATQDYIKVKGTYQPKQNDLLKGVNSGVIATIGNLINHRGQFNIDYSVRKESGWLSEIGKLNESHQSISDNDYYQNLSYTVKSTIPFNDLINPVNRILHTSGLKNFSDTQVLSRSADSYKSQIFNDDLIILDINEEKRVDTINNFDFARDIDVIDQKSLSLELKNKKLSDYIDCISNRVLPIDDISGQFSNRGSNTDIYSDISTIEDSYYKYLIQIIAPDTNDIQVTELVILSNNKDVFTLDKSTLTNTSILPGTIQGVIDEFDTKSLRFTPTDPLNIDYDIKVLETRFNTDLIGINTLSVGFINLTGLNTSVGIGTTITVISFKKDEYKSLFANIQLLNVVQNNMNYVELFLDHDNQNTYISEYYFDTNDGISTSIMGSFNSIVDGDDIHLQFYNNENNIVLIRSKIVGFGSTSVGIGTYRFILPGQLPGNERSAIFETRYELSSSSTVDIIGVSTENITTVKSLVRVSYGETSSLHQVLMVQDKKDVYTLQYPFLSIGSTSGIGTFGGEISGSNAILKFYPDDNIFDSIEVQSFNELLYADSDIDNDSPTLEYGTITENVVLGGYDSINGTRANRLNFKLLYQNTPIYSKTFNPSNLQQLDPSTGIFTIKNHFFNTGERLNYRPESSFIGIDAISMGIGSTLNSSGIVTNILPKDVYAIRLNDDQFRLATRQDYAYVGTYVTFTSLGSGNSHKLGMFKKLEKSIISIDGVVQSPITYCPLSYTLENNGGQIGIADTYFSISGISSLRPKDLLKIDDEFVNIISVGLGTTFSGPITGFGTYPLVYAERGFVGSSSSTHSDGTNVQLYRGSFNIVDDSIYFTEAPKGSGRIRRTTGNLPFPFSNFSGRVYLRNDYTNNLLFDNISDYFTGIGRTYTLSVLGSNEGSTEPGSGVVFINGVFQTPTTFNNDNNNYNLISSAGISSIVFSGITSTNGDIIISDFDVNQNQLPRGGIIVSLGSTPGLGFAPLVGAKAKAIVGFGGSIANITCDSYIGVGKNVSTAFYSNKTGIVKITTLEPHGLKGGDLIKLSGLGFTCPSSSGIISYFPLSDLSGSYGVSNIHSPNTFSAFVGYSSLPHTYVGMGTIYPWYDLNHGSGYQDPVSIKIRDINHSGTDANITTIVGAGGTLSFVVNSGGTGYTTTTITIDIPDPVYENLEVVGVSRLSIGNTTETGKNLLLTLEVGASSTTGIGSTLFEVTSFQISRPGYGFEIGDVFKPIGLVTDKNLSEPLSNFELTVLDTFTDSFSAWQFGELDYIDSIKFLQDGTRVRFPLRYNGNLLSFEKDPTNLIDLNAILLIFVNGVIQKPEEAYSFTGGTSFIFTEPPKVEDNISIFFYRGTRGIDSKLVDAIESLKEGDLVQLYKNDFSVDPDTQNIRTVYSITGSDTIETNLYFDKGINETIFRPLNWSKQKIDTIIRGKLVYKTRESIAAQIYPSSHIIKDINLTDSSIFVDNIEFFNYEENNYGFTIDTFDALMIEDTHPVSAGLTAIVSPLGTIQSIDIVDPGSGYVGTTANIKISAPKNIKPGIGTIATAEASIVNGSISTPITITNPGLGYTVSSPPQVVVDVNTTQFKTETIQSITNVQGFSGIITGITTTTGIGDNALALKFFANASSFVDLEVGYPLYIFNTPTGNGIISIDFDENSIVGIGTEYLDNIYYIHSLSVFGNNAEIISNISPLTNISGITTFGSISSPVGKFSWGRLYNFNRPNAVSIGVTGFTIDSNLSAFPTIQRRGYGLRDNGSIRNRSNI